MKLLVLASSQELTLVPWGVNKVQFYEKENQ